MDISCKKLIEYLKETVQFILSRVVLVNELSSLPITSIEEKEEAMKKDYSMFYEEYQRAKKLITLVESVANDETHNELYDADSLNNLSQFLLECPLKNNDRVQIIMKFIENNVKNASLVTSCEYIKGYDIAKIDEYKFKYFTKDEVKEFIRTNRCVELLNTSDDKLSEIERNKKVELNNFLNVASYDMNEVVKQSLIIKNHYYDKLDSYDMKDVEIIMDTLSSMKIETSILNGIEKILLKDLQKRIKTTTINTDIFKVSIETANPTLSKKEHHQLLLEVQQYFDLNNKKVIKNEYIKLSEKIHLISLLRKIDYTDDQIKKILRLIDNENQKYSDINPITKYNDLRDKIQYYNQKGYCLEELKDLEDYFNEILNGEDSKFWENELSDILETTMKKLPNDYEYELEITKTYSKK